MALRGIEVEAAFHSLVCAHQHVGQPFVADQGRRAEIVDLAEAAEPFGSQPSPEIERGKQSAALGRHQRRPQIIGRRPLDLAGRHFQRYAGVADLQAVVAAACQQAGERPIAAAELRRRVPRLPNAVLLDRVEIVIGKPAFLHKMPLHDLRQGRFGWRRGSPLGCRFLPSLPAFRVSSACRRAWASASAAPADARPPSPAVRLRCANPKAAPQCRSVGPRGGSSSARASLSA